ncbi:MAG: HAD family phosphatase [Synergistaceae bacterium]|jgi:HAD superfamily hydrolase (TIGR01509 family)|nr:HAD family phosphatase [Synergistaceae bacterium]
MGAPAVIFDMDGTILDSMGVWEKIDADFLARRGLSVPAGYFDDVGHMCLRDAASYTIRRFSLPDSPDELVREWNDMACDEYAHNIPMKRGAREYLHRLEENGAKMAIATSSPIGLCIPALRNNGVEGFFDAVCTADEVGRGKESPDIFILAAKKLMADPRDCIVFEDNLRAAQSARAAGMSVWGVYDDSAHRHWEEMKRFADGWTIDFANAPIA